MRKLLLLVTLLLAAPAALCAEEAPVMSLDSFSGLVRIMRNGETLEAQEGMRLLGQDVVSTEASGSAQLMLARHGFVELGGDSQLVIENLPITTYAKDLNTAFSVPRGYLRVVWKRPQTSTVWPLYVYMGATRATLGAGEFFFQQVGNSQRLCSAAGVLALQTMVVTQPTSIPPPGCAQITASGQLTLARRDPNDWLGVRTTHDVRAGEPVLVEVAAAPVLASATTAPTTQAMPAKPGYDYSLIEGSAPLATSPVAPPRPVVAEALPTTAAPEAATRFEIASAPAPTAPLAAIPALGPVPTAPMAATPPAAALAAGSWCINIASISERPGAESVASYARNFGLSAAIVPAQVKGKTWYRVQVGHYPSAAAARLAAPELMQMLSLDDVWYTRAP